MCSCLDWIRWLARPLSRKRQKAQTQCSPPAQGTPVPTTYTILATTLPHLGLSFIFYGDLSALQRDYQGATTKQVWASTAGNLPNKECIEPSLLDLQLLFRVLSDSMLLPGSPESRPVNQLAQKKAGLLRIGATSVSSRCQQENRNAFGETRVGEGPSKSSS